MSLKSVVERLLSGPTAVRLGRARRAGSTLVLAYHNVVEDDSPPSGDRSLHLGLENFRSQLDAVTSLGAVVPLEEVPGARSEGLRFAITFDDAYRGAIRLAIPELQNRGLPATVFVAPGLLGAPQTWWDLMAGPQGLAPEVRSRCLEELAGDGRRIVQQFGKDLTPPRDPDLRIATDDELRGAVSGGHLTLAAHSWNHPNLCRLSADEVRAEFDSTNQWLSTWPEGSTGPWCAYPYGLENRAVRELAAQAGYAAAFTIGGGWYVAGSDAMRMPRYNVPAGLSLQGFLARICGLLEP